MRAGEPHVVLRPDPRGAGGVEGRLRVEEVHHPAETVLVPGREQPHTLFRRRESRAGDLRAKRRLLHAQIRLRRLERRLVPRAAVVRLRPAELALRPFPRSASRLNPSKRFQVSPTPTLQRTVVGGERGILGVHLIRRREADRRAGTPTSGAPRCSPRSRPAATRRTGRRAAVVPASLSDGVPGSGNSGGGPMTSTGGAPGSPIASASLRRASSSRFSAVTFAPSAEATATFARNTSEASPIPAASRLSAIRRCSRASESPWSATSTNCLRRDDVEDRGDDPVDRVLLPPVEVVTLRVRLHLRHPVSAVRLRGEERLLERKGADEVVARRRAVEVAHIGEIRREQHSLVHLEGERLRGDGRAYEPFIEPDGREKVPSGRVRVIARGDRLFLRPQDKRVARQRPGDRLGKIHRLHRRRGRRKGKTERQKKQRRHGQGGNVRISGGSGHSRLLVAECNDLLQRMQQPRFPRWDSTLRAATGLWTSTGYSCPRVVHAADARPGPSGNIIPAARQDLHPLIYIHGSNAEGSMRAEWRFAHDRG